MKSKEKTVRSRDIFFKWEEGQGIEEERTRCGKEILRKRIEENRAFANEKKTKS